MSDMMPVVTKTNPINITTDAMARPDTNPQLRQDKDTDQRAVILSVDASNIQKEAKKPQDLEKAKEVESILKNVRTVSVSYDKNGLPIVKFLDSKGNTVLQVPPEEYLRMKELAADEDSQKIPDIVNKKV
jgi:uncharacterized FlaG/YvyC family protein